MNKALVWLGVLAVVVIVVVVLAAQGDGDGKDAGKTGDVVGNPALDPVQERGNTTYDVIAGRLARVEPAGMMYALRELDLQTVTGSGTVVSVEEEQDGVVHIVASDEYPLFDAAQLDFLQRGDPVFGLDRRGLPGAGHNGAP